MYNNDKDRVRMNALFSGIGSSGSFWIKAIIGLLLAFVNILFASGLDFVFCRFVYFFVDLS